MSVSTFSLSLVQIFEAFAQNVFLDIIIDFHFKKAFIKNIPLDLKFTLKVIEKKCSIKK